MKKKRVGYNIRKNVKVHLPKQKRWIDRINKDSFDASGLSIDDILNIDPVKLLRLGTEQFKDITQRLVSASNKRIKYLESDDIGKISPAYQKYLREGRKFTTKFKNVYKDSFDANGNPKKVLVMTELNQLRNEFARAKEFLNMKTSTKRGFKKLKKQFETKFGADTPLTAQQYKDFWGGFRKFEEQNKGAIVSHKIDSDRLLRQFYKKQTGKTQKSMEDFIKESYEQRTKEKLEEEQEEELTDVFSITNDILD